MNWRRLMRRHYHVFPVFLPPFGMVDIGIAWTPLELALVVGLIVGQATGLI